MRPALAPAPAPAPAGTPPSRGVLAVIARVVDAPRPPQPLLWASALVLVLEYAFDLRRAGMLRPIALWLGAALVLGTVALIAARAVRAQLKHELRAHWSDLAFVAAIVLLGLAGGLRVAAAVAAVRNLWRLAAHVAGHFLARRLAPTLVARPMALLSASFAVTILAGTVLLMARAATTDGRGASLVTALFTATSATCVTGLTVVDTGAYFTRFGQWVILLLIQIGGLGIMTITTALAVLLRAQLSARLSGAMQQILDESTLTGFRRLLGGILALTIGIEALGALALYGSMSHGAGGAPLAFGDRAFYAAFHAVSAFCNAGFGLYRDSLVPFVGSVPVNLTIMLLIILGGLGFPVLVELLRPARWRRGPHALWHGLSLHARLALVTTGLLIGGGAFGVLVLEWTGVLGPLPLPTTGLAAFFQSVTFRTAGFNTIDFAAVKPATLAFGMALMFIGGSPSSTAGGIKTTTLAVLVLALRAMVRRRADVEAYGRTIAKGDVYRAVAVLVLTGLTLFVGCVCLLITDGEKPFGHLLFEAVSAFATVGLSAGVTPGLSVPGKLVIVVLMFIGRIGPFSIALLVGEERATAYAYPEGKTLVG